jgi:hypothetical protein
MTGNELNAIFLGVGVATVYLKFTLGKIVHNIPFVKKNIFSGPFERWI